MKVQEYADAEGQTRYCLICTTSEHFYYDDMMHRQGMGRVVVRNREGPLVEYFKPLSWLTERGKKQYSWIDLQGKQHDYTLPFYSEASK